jgi:hypothetical protein
MHEVIVPKRTAMGWPKKQRGLINHRFNCVLVCPGGGTGCHSWAHAHPDVMVAKIIVQRGWGTLAEWVATLPFKVPFSWYRGILNEEEARDLLRKV